MRLYRKVVQYFFLSPWSLPFVSSYIMLPVAVSFERALTRSSICVRFPPAAILLFRLGKRSLAFPSEATLISIFGNFALLSKTFPLRRVSGSRVSGSQVSGSRVPFSLGFRSFSCKSICFPLVFSACCAKTLALRRFS